MADAHHREVDSLFFDAAARHADAVAIDAGPRRWTYAELAGEVRRLSAWLRAWGGPVAALTGDPARAIPALLASLDAGCTYVPLDPAWPAARLAAVAADIRPAALLVDPAVAGHAALGVAPDRTLRLDQLASLPEAPRSPAPEAPAAASTLFFTSGTTGRPKGILGRPGAIAHYVAWEARLLGAGPGLRVSALAPTSFDASLRDACLPLSVGGTVCVPPDRGVFADGARLAAWLEAARVEVVHTVPTVFRALLVHAPSLPALRVVLLAGEALRPSDVARFFAVFGERARGERVALYNLYGPTETTMTRLFHRVTAADAEGATVPLGRPMDDTEVFVVDSAGRPRPPDRPGEIVLRTPWAALGYLDRPEETARAFVTDLLADGSPLPVYRTGDLGVQRADGIVELRGRRDLQVKLRGVRLELEEVEAALAAAPGVVEAAAALRDGPDGEPRLVAWVVGGAGVEALRAHLAATLPPAAVPARVVALDALPRLVNGKLDRAALRLPHAAATAGEPTRGPLEARVAGVLAEVLGCAVGAADDFFALGGDSLQALRALWRLNEALGVELPVDLLYDARTVRAVAARVASGAPAVARGGFEALELAPGRGRPVFWLPPAYGLTLPYRALAERLPGRPSVGLELSRPLETGDPRGATVEALAAAAAQATRARQPEGPYTLVGWSFGGVLAFEIARQLAPGDVDRLVLLDSAAPGEDFDFAAGDPETAALAARRIGHMFGRPLELDAASLRGLAPDVITERVLDLAAAHGVPISPEIRRQALGIIRVREASMAAWRRYAPAPLDDGGRGATWIVRARDAEADWTARWSAFVGGPIERRVVAGDHLGMLDEPHVATLLAVLEEALYAPVSGGASPISSASTE